LHNTTLEPQRARRRQRRKSRAAGTRSLEERKRNDDLGQDQGEWPQTERPGRAEPTARKKEFPRAHVREGRLADALVFLLLLLLFPRTACPLASPATNRRRGTPASPGAGHQARARGRRPSRAGREPVSSPQGISLSLSPALSLSLSRVRSLRCATSNNWSPIDCQPEASHGPTRQRSERLILDKIRSIDRKSAIITKR